MGNPTCLQVIVSPAKRMAQADDAFEALRAPRVARAASSLVDRLQSIAFERCGSAPKRSRAPPSPTCAPSTLGAWANAGFSAHPPRSRTWASNTKAWHRRS